MTAEQLQTSPLLFRDLHVGRRIGPQSVVITSSMVDAYVATTGDDNPLYRDESVAAAAGFDGPIVPPGLVGMLARRAYLDGHHLRPGGVMAGQDVDFLDAALVGAPIELDAEVEVVDHDHPRQRVVVRSDIRSRGRVVAVVRIDARWPPDEPGDAS